MRTNVGKRLQYIRADVTQREFAATLGVALRTYQNYEQGERAPSAEVLRAIAGLGWNPTWLLTGDGEEQLPAGHLAAPHADYAGMVAGDPDATQRWQARKSAYMAGLRAGVSESRGMPTDFDDYLFLPHLSVTAAAGNGQMIESEQLVAWMAFRKSYLQMLGVPAQAACLIRVRGDSMDPDLRDGDTVLADTADVNVRDRPRIFVIRYPDNNDLIVKCLRRLEDGTWYVNGSANSTETTIPADAQKPLIIGRVRWSGRTWA